ncbi:MAG: hypothetical protein DI539_03600 [Flavobacterium psychrophilum]|nr:MAG: hypothetical protein DI539_03600 [Flavobacterium psychrophilum]
MTSLLKDLPELVTNNVISPQTAKDIENYYIHKKQPQGNNLMAIFGVLGATLVGLGIILIFAHNWDNFSRTVKTALALLPLISFQALTAYTILKDKSTVWKQTSGTLLFFSVGAAIALIAQIYNIPGNTASFLCTWTVLCLPLVYILRANILGILHIIFATWYAAIAGYEDDNLPWMYVAFIAAFIPFYIERHRSGHTGFTGFMNLLLPVSGTIVLGTFLDNEYAFNLITYLGFFGLLYAVGQLPFFRNFGFRGNGYHIVSQAGIIFVMMLMSFKWFWEMDNMLGIAPFTGILWCVILVATIGISYKYELLQRADPFILAILASPLFYFVGYLNPLAAMAFVNIITLALGVAIIRKGVAKIDLPLLNFGLVIVSVLIICRFFDTYMTFAIRGLLFVAVGAGFFAANYILIRKKKNLETATHEN